MIVCCLGLLLWFALVAVVVCCCWCCMIFVGVCCCRCSLRGAAGVIFRRCSGVCYWTLLCAVVVCCLLLLSLTSMLIVGVGVGCFCVQLFVCCN